MISVNSQLNLSTADKNFVDLINNRITMYGQIPYTVPQKLIVEIIKESARLFHRTYFKATETKFYYLDAKSVELYVTNNPSTLSSNVIGYWIKLPTFIGAVFEIYEANIENWDVNDKFIESVQLAQRASPYGQSVLGINNQLYILDSACSLVYLQAFRSVMGASVPFHFNTLTKDLHIEKELKDNLILKVLGNVDIQYLYNDDLYIRHVIARTKQELKRLIASHVIELPGNATLNADEICNNIEDVEKVEDTLKTSGGIGDLILMRD
jgi:hypothetical protein